MDGTAAHSHWKGDSGKKWHVASACSYATRALDELYARVMQELRAYRAFAVEIGDPARVGRADEALAWASGRGREVVMRFKLLAAVSDDVVGRRIAEAARALVGLAGIARRRDMSDAENWDMVRDWAEQALGMLEAGIGAWVAEYESPALDLPNPHLPAFELNPAENEPPKYSATVLNAQEHAWTPGQLPLDLVAA